MRVNHLLATPGTVDCTLQNRVRADRRSWLSLIGLGGLMPLLSRSSAETAPLVKPLADTVAAGETPRWFLEPQDRLMIESLSLKPGARVLDAGCGRGNHLQLFSEQPGVGMVTGVDLDTNRVKSLRQRFQKPLAEERVDLIEADVQRLPFEDGTFDLIWSSHVMHILSDPVAGVRELARVCRPGGRVVIREDGLSARLLPLDTGVGEPGLESRWQAAFTKWFVADRLKRGRVPFGWQTVLSNAGLQEVTTRSFLFEASPPFSPLQEESLLHRVRGWMDEEISEEDRHTIAILTDVSSPHYLLRRSDLHFVDVATVFIGRTAG